MKSILRNIALVAVVSMVMGLLPAAMPTAIAAAPGGAGPGCDFDGDGYDDLAIGSPGRSVNGLAGAGDVVIVYGAARFVPKTARTMVLDQATPGIKSHPAPGEQFGAAVACGDFDGDGYDDLAVGVPGQEAEGQARAGAIQVFRGTKNGVTTRNDFLWTQGVPGVPGVGQRNDRLGSALASGDFNGDGYADLAAGAPFDDDPGRNSGAVLVISGGTSGLDQSTLLTQSTAGIPSIPEWGDGYGAALAAGDFNGDGRDDLAVGAPTESIGNLAAGGVVIVTPGSAAGLTGTGSVMWHQDVAGIEDTAEVFDEFGGALAAGDANGDGFDELAIGVPGENLESGANAGMVQVLAGSATGLTTTRIRTWTQDRPALPGSAGADHRFGGALAFADFTGDGFADVAIGAPGDGFAGSAQSGSVTVLKGSSIGIRARNFSLTQDSMNKGGRSQAGDEFGSSITAADVNGDGIADLAASAPGEDFALGTNWGDVVVWSGTTGGAASSKARRITRSVVKAGTPGSGEAFGTVGGTVVSQVDLIDTFDSLAAVSAKSSVNTVADLEGFLAHNGFYREVIDGRYDERLASAIVAFHKATGQARLAAWSSTDWARLHNYTPSLPVRNEPNRVEVDLSQQVLYLMEENEVTAVVAIASGTSSTPTPRGNFSIGRHITGWRISYLGGLYYPWYFYGGYAVHGSKSVPVSPASHGCVRIELWESLNLESRFFIGLPVHITD